jgi:hypothetical protein
MSTSPYWTETTRRVGHDDWEGDCIEVQPDSDGSGNVEVRYCHQDGTFGASISIPPECAARLAQAITACGDELIAAKVETEQAARPNADF